jgi:putative ABC transport system permease protein
LAGNVIATLLPVVPSYMRRYAVDRKTGSGRYVDTLRQDMRSAFRAVRRDLGLFSFAVIIVGLGVGASTAVFSVMSPLMLRPLPFDDPGNLVWIANDRPESGMSGVTSRTANLMDFREQSSSFEGLTGYFAFFEQRSYTLAGDGPPERLKGVDVAQDFLDVLGVQLEVGRNFVDEEGVWDGRNAVILTHGFWTRRYAADPSIVGTSITLDNSPRVVVGVLPPSFDFSGVFAPTTHVDFLLPFPISPETDRWGNTLSMVGRLRPGATPESAQAELDRIVLGLQEADPERWGLAAVVSPLQQQISGPFKSGFLLLAAAAGGVMLIVCVNLSNLLLAKGPKRMREMAVRSALGAPRQRLLRQLMIESLILAGVGSIVGVGIAALVTRFVASSSGISIPMLSDVSVDGWALLFTATLAIVAGVLVGIVPAMQISNGGESAAMKGGRGSSAGRRTTRLRESLVVAEVALACVLLVTGGLLVKSFQRVLDVDLGFEAAGAVAWQINPSVEFNPYSGPEGMAEVNAYFDQIASRIADIPGVEAVGLSDALPLGRNRTWGFRGVGVVYENDEGVSAFPHLVDHRYIEAMEIPLLEGRNFTSFDNWETENVVVINETAAKEIFQTTDALGLTLQNQDDWRVIGIVADVRHQSPEMGAGPEVYFSMAQNGDFGTMDLVVRSRQSAEALAPAVIAAVGELDAAIPMRDYETLDAVVGRALSPRRFTVSLLGAFAAAALLLAAIGIYGVLSYSVTERIPEIGIRMTLGESAGQVRRRVVGRTMVLALTGVGIGAIGSMVISRSIGSLLYGVAPTDPRTFVGMALLLLVVAAAAGFMPALRASRTDPAIALREG